MLAKSRGTVDGAVTIVQSGDSCGEIAFSAADGVDFNIAAGISAIVSAAPGSNNTPGSLLFHTAAASATVATERMRIDHTGAVYIGDSANANSVIGLTINQGANDDEILALKSSDVAHGVTTHTETDTYAFFKKASGSTGGLIIEGSN
jgi:hypothetical protein